jgi:hypothetical protein
MWHVDEVSTGIEDVIREACGCGNNEMETGNGARR